MFLDLDVKLAKYAPPKWKDEVIVNLTYQISVVNIMIQI